MNEINRNSANMILEISTLLLLVLMYLADKMKYGKVLSFVPLAIMILIHISKGKMITITRANLGFLLYTGVSLLYVFMSMFWAETPSRTIAILKAMFVIFI